MAKIDREELRKLVREALREALGGGASPAAKTVVEAQRNMAPVSPPAPSPAPKAGFVAALRAALAKGRPARVAVAMKSSDDLGRFARDVVDASGYADLKAAILSGDLAFDMAGTVVASAAKPTLAGAYEMTAGVLSETKIVEIARTHKKIAVGADVVLTPLARDKARELKVELTRQKP